jgi:endo-1,4-beta-D-glucanase Y
MFILASASSAQRGPPVLPTTGAVASGVWRNVFREAGYSQASIDARLASITQQLFWGTDDQRLLYSDSVGSYVFSPDSNDVRTEGQSYGLMWSVQLNNQTMFDSLFAWFKAHMQHNSDPSDPRYGYSSWHCQTSGASMDPNPASDGETFIATALLFAARRWGDASGRFNYTKEFRFILDAALSKEAPPCPLQGCQSITNMFGGYSGLADGAPQLVRFVPYASASTFTDASYMATAFYKAWAASDTVHAPYWENVTAASRAFFALAAHPTTGLMPDYSDWSGRGTNGHTTFSFDAWRAARNMATDYAWYAEDPAQVELCNRLLTFFRGTAKWPLYQNEWNLDGTPTGSGDHSPGLVAMNAVAVLASNLTLAWDFVDQLWSTPTPSGRYRYYDGVLFLEAHLALSGNYRSW